MTRGLTKLAAVGAGTVFVPLLARAAEVPAGSYGWGPPMMWGWGGSRMIFGPLFMLLVLAVVIAVVVFLVRWLGGSQQGMAPRGRTPLDILNDRFARGEIDEKEYEGRRRVLGG